MVLFDRLCKVKITMAKGFFIYSFPFESVNKDAKDTYMALKCRQTFTGRPPSQPDLVPFKALCFKVT